MKSKFDISKETKENMAETIMEYFATERGEDIGNLAAMLMTDFIIEEIGPIFYNLGVEESKSYIEEKLDDMYGIMK
ncbi:DUF2164 domain-containing protein [Virgibacillus siamensis]|uniref:DUF2164 domain-containing protein n=1 Tax=Virgibacillus siamensis TaxID=480071 RepID=UPI000984EA37|nr:DUF2164 domain-containing protein [Virgibacillus siamensis]